MNLGCVTRVILAAGLVSTISAAASAGDDRPPYWRGSSNSFHGVWTFPDDSTPDQPELGAFNPLIEAVATMTAFASERGGPEWFAEFEDRDGAWRVPRGAGLRFDVPNYDTENLQKWIRVQVKYYNPVGEPGGFGRGDSILIQPLMSDAQAGGFDIQSFSPFGGVPVDNQPGWYSVVWDFVVRPSPALEAVVLTNIKTTDLYFDQVVIDTWSVTTLPAAPTAALIAVAGLLAARRRRA